MFLLLQRIFRRLENESCYKRPNSCVCVMDDGEYLLENCNVVTLASVWDCLNSIYKAFFVYTICSSIPLLSKIHILIS